MDEPASPKDYWDESDEQWIRCTCTEECAALCHGECGCEACTASYRDYLSSPMSLE